MPTGIVSPANSIPKRLLPLLVDSLRQALEPSPDSCHLDSSGDRRGNNTRLELIALLGGVPAPLPPPLTKADLMAMLGPLLDKVRQVGESVPMSWRDVEREIHETEQKLEEMAKRPPRPMAPDSPALQQQVTVLTAALSFVHETCLLANNEQSFHEGKRMELESQIREMMVDSPYRRLSDALQSDVDKHLKTIARLQAELTPLQQHLSTNQRQLETTTAQNTLMNGQLQDSIASVNSLQQQVEELERRLGESNRQIETVRKLVGDRDNKGLQDWYKERLNKKILEMASLPDYTRETIKVLYPNEMDRLNRLIKLENIGRIIALTSEDITKLKSTLSNMKAQLSTNPILPPLYDESNRDRFQSILTLYWYVFWEGDKDRNTIIADVGKIVKMYCDREERDRGDGMIIKCMYNTLGMSAIKHVKEWGVDRLDRWGWIEWVEE